MAANPLALVESEGQVSGAMEPEPGMVANHEGGFVHQISDMARFRRFLILGSEANCFYASAQVSFSPPWSRPNDTISTKF